MRTWTHELRESGGGMRIPLTFDPRGVCRRLGFDPKEVRSVVMYPDKCLVEIAVRDSEGNFCIQGDDLVTTFVTLKRETA